MIIYIMNMIHISLFMLDKPTFLDDPFLFAHSMQQPLFLDLKFILKKLEKRGFFVQNPSHSVLS